MMAYHQSLFLPTTSAASQTSPHHMLTHAHNITHHTKRIAHIWIHLALILRHLGAPQHLSLLRLCRTRHSIPSSSHKMITWKSLFYPHPQKHRITLHPHSICYVHSPFPYLIRIHVLSPLLPTSRTIVIRISLSRIQWRKSLRKLIGFTILIFFRVSRSNYHVVSLYFRLISLAKQMAHHYLHTIVNTCS